MNFETAFATALSTDAEEKLAAHFDSYSVDELAELLKTASMDILLVSLADKLDNIKAIREDYSRHGEKLWARFRRPREKQKWYYQSLVKAFRKRARKEPLGSLFSEFRREVQEVFG